MNLTGKQIVDQGIITGHIDVNNVQQHGVDLNVVHIQSMKGVGFIPSDLSKLTTKLVTYEDVISQEVVVSEVNDTSSLMLSEKRTDLKKVAVWKLDVGAYNVTMEQGCQIPENQRMQIVQRSSLLRNGTILASSIFDAGFKTANIGTVIIVSHPILIEVGARIAQAYVSSSNKVENLYDGQWQEDKQRK